ncbi:hypothetical protein HPB49_002025 [Dermacentor silvarum]|uniref:Uncharacterized protein n=1 Tax=Dermacentor silvarum TaxID=543639 RepID=A0ACB8DTA8_DERSI|nr:hypothetical protein HPB49_002025 [Dermacentor silvarum]
MRECTKVDVSLLGPSKCIDALSKSRTRRVSYRGSKLTHNFKDSLGDSRLGLMIAAVTPSKVSYLEACNTLNYAERAVQMKPQANKNVLNANEHISVCSALIEEYKEEVEGLQLTYEKTATENTAPETKEEMVDGPLELASLLQGPDCWLATTVRRMCAVLPPGNLGGSFEGFTTNGISSSDSRIGPHIRTSADAVGVRTWSPRLQRPWHHPRAPCGRARQIRPWKTTLQGWECLTRYYHRSHLRRMCEVDASKEPEQIEPPPADVSCHSNFSNRLPDVQQGPATACNSIPPAPKQAQLVRHSSRRDQRSPLLPLCGTALVLRVGGTLTVFLNAFSLLTFVTARLKGSEVLEGKATTCVHW